MEIETNENIEKAVSAYIKDKHLFDIFMRGVVEYFRLEPSLNLHGSPVIHTIKSRLKDVNHLRDKIKRKWNDDNPISEINIFDRITDLAGVRVLHLYQDQFSELHNYVQERIQGGDWFLRETPIAYSWDPESSDFFSQLGLTPKIKDSYYKLLCI